MALVKLYVGCPFQTPSLKVIVIFGQHKRDLPCNIVGIRIPFYNTSKEEEGP